LRKNQQSTYVASPKQQPFSFLTSRNTDKLIKNAKT
jgi:hypothetical protein